jgi:hypothetical protein
MGSGAANNCMMRTQAFYNISINWSNHSTHLSDKPVIWANDVPEKDVPNGIQLRLFNKDSPSLTCDTMLTDFDGGEIDPK